MMTTDSKLPQGLAILDNSMVLAMLMPDEVDATAALLLKSLDKLQLHAPALWAIEFANALNTNIRRKRITAEQANSYCKIVDLWGIAVDTQTHKPLALSQLARDTGLTSYDATYLELSRRLNAPLYTLDQKLAAAASA